MLIIGGIVGLLVVVGIIFFFVSKSDPASQAPNEPPTFNAASKAQEHAAPPGDRNPNMRR